MALTVYHIKESILGKEVQSFDDIVKEYEEIQAFDPKEDLELNCRLYVQIKGPRHPTWINFLLEGFQNLEIPEYQSTSAVLLIQLSYDGGEHFFAVTFGHGRFILKPGAYRTGFGLKTALNLIYDNDADGQAPSRIRAVDSKTVGSNTMRTRRQTDRRSLFETFEVDIEQDLLNAITGRPVSTDSWGTRVSGADSFQANPKVVLEQLGEYCEQLLESHYADDYESNFSWIDNYASITEPDLLADLESTLIKAIIENTLVVSLVVPGILEWSDVDYFEVTFDSDERFSDPEDHDLFERLTALDLIEDLEINQLRKKWSLKAFNNDEEMIGGWPLMKCLTTELKYNNKTYILSEGLFYEVSENYLNDLNQFIGAILESVHELPDSEGDPVEGEYNELAADSSDEYLLMDKATVKISKRTSTIEVCDIFTKSGAFIHVKRKLSSSSLSHLFGQGTVSADLLHMNKEFRQVVIDKIQEIEADTNVDGFSSLINIDSVNPREFEVVYAIVAKWHDKSLVEKLPFFSKVHLRNHIKNLRRMGYRVSVDKIPVT